MTKAGERNAYWILVAKPEGKAPTRIWEHNIQTSRKDILMVAVDPEIRTRIMIV